MSNQQAIVVLDVEPWFVELNSAYRLDNPHNPLEFTFEDFTALTSAVMDVMHCPVGHDKRQLYQYAIHMFMSYISPDNAQSVIDRYIQQLNIQLEHTNSSMLPTLNLRYRSWITSSYHLYITYDNRESTITPTEYTRAGLLAAIEHGDFINERTRREYGL